MPQTVGQFRESVVIQTERPMFELGLQIQIHIQKLA